MQHKCWEGERAFEALYNYYKAAARGFAWSILRDWGDSEDVIQECFTKIHKKIIRKELIKDFKAFINALIHNASVDVIRKRRPTVRLGSVIKVAGSESVEIEIREIRKLAHDAIYRLEHKYKTIIILKHFEGLTLKKIAELCGKPYQTVRLWHIQALQILRQELEDREGEVTGNEQR
jgi:RNA polymerase sigma-70 factor (ECF subfamily)